MHNFHLGAVQRAPGPRAILASPCTFLLLLLAACGTVRAPETAGVSRDGTIRVGLATVDITPSEPIRLSGYPSRRLPTDSIAQRLAARAIAFDGGPAGPAVLIVAELIGVPAALTESLAERLVSAGIAREQLVVAATHTHNGPSLTGVLPFIFGEPVPAEQQAVIDRYTGDVLDRLEEVALSALADFRPARLSWGQGSAAFAVNRRVLREGRWVGFGAVPEAPADHDLPVLAVHDPDGSLRAVLLSYATHCTTLVGDDNFVHGDWAGAAQALISERHPGATALVMIGAGADSDPQPRGGGLPHVHRHGEEIADAVDRLLAAGLRPIETPPVGRFRAIDLQFARTPTAPELETQAVQTGAAGLLARTLLARHGRGEPIATTARYPIQSWNFGDDLLMVFLAGEVVVDYSLRLKRELDRDRLWVSAYANDVDFYVPSRRILEEGGYEADASMIFYGHPSRLASDTEERIIGSVGDLVPAWFSAGHR